MIPFSVLDLSPVPEGKTVADSFRNSLDLAQHAERWDFRRIWVAEHHGHPGVASAATALIVQHLAAGTNKIRVGAGGIMLPNHAPLMIAEQFGTLEALFPGRIDLGLGRAPGTDPVTSRALRRSLSTDVDEFPRDVVELMNYFTDRDRQAPVQATPGAGAEIPIWILGSSTFGAQLEAELGLPFAFASHFAPTHLYEALELYRARFQPSDQLDRPYVMLGFNVFAADTDEEGEFLASSMQQYFVNSRTGGKPSKMRPPLRNYLSSLGPNELAILRHTFSCSAVGSRTTVQEGLESFISRTQADELMLTSHIFDHQARLRSFEIAAAIAKG